MNEKVLGKVNKKKWKIVEEGGWVGRVEKGVEASNQPKQN